MDAEALIGEYAQVLEVASSTGHEQLARLLAEKLVSGLRLLLRLDEDKSFTMEANVFVTKGKWDFVEDTLILHPVGSPESWFYGVFADGEILRERRSGESKFCQEYRKVHR